MDKKRIMIQMPVTAGIRSVLDTRDDVEYERFTELSEENILQHIGNYDGAILGGMAPFTARIIGSAPRLRVVSRHGVGYNNVDVDALTAAGVPLTVTGTANSVTVAEHSLFFMMSLAKHGVLFDREVRKGNWNIRFENTAIDLSRPQGVDPRVRPYRAASRETLPGDGHGGVRARPVRKRRRRPRGGSGAGGGLAFAPSPTRLSLRQLPEDGRDDRNGRGGGARGDEAHRLCGQHRSGRDRRRAGSGGCPRAPGHRRGGDRRVRGRARDRGPPVVRARQHPGDPPLGRGSPKNPCSGWGPHARRTWSTASTGSSIPRTSSTGRCWAETAPVQGIPGGTRRKCPQGEAIRPLADSRPRSDRGDPARS